jgi:putative NADPH-quinone reductase
MKKHILIIQGHPDPAHHFGHSLANAYAQGAESSGHEVKWLTIASLALPPLHSKREWDAEPTSPAVHSSQEALRWAEHVVIVYPLWLGSMPALLKAFFEQVFRPGFAIAEGEPGKLWKKLLKGRSARVVVTMGMPSLLYRWFYRAHSLKSLERNILAFVGFAPVRSNVIGMVEAPDGARREKWLATMRKLGARAV